MTRTEVELLAAYLIVGDDELKVTTVIKRLCARLEQAGNVDFNTQSFEGGKENDGKEILDSLNTPPLAAPYRLVIIKEAEKLSKQVVNELIDYLESPLPSSVLLMTATKLKQQSRLYKAVGKLSPKALIDASSRKRSELPAMARQLAKSYDIALSYDGAHKLCELVGTSSVNLNTEIKKLASYVLSLGRREASLDDVLAVVARSHQPSVWDFVDALARRDLVASFDILQLLSRESPVSLLYLCLTRFREILLYQSLAARKDGKLAQTLGKPDWQLKKLEKLAQGFREGELRALLTLAATSDERIKSGTDASLVLEEIILAVCA